MVSIIPLSLEVKENNGLGYFCMVYIEVDDHMIIGL